jgi:predicted nucleic acid-binding protein
VIVVDSNVVVKLLLDEPDSDLAARLIADALNAGDEIVAPALLPIEVSNVVRQRVRAGALTAQQAMRRMVGFNGLPISIAAGSDFELRSLTLRALSLANEFDMAASYDAHYVALAEMYGCDLWTADDRMVNLLWTHLPFVRALADFVPAGGDD